MLMSNTIHTSKDVHRLGVSQTSRANRTQTQAFRAQRRPQAQLQKQEPVPYTGPDPKKFGVAPGQLLNVASAAFPAVTRLLCGGFVAGYKSSFPKDDGGYAVAQVGGRKVFETSDRVASFPRPAKPLELYEFEGCPFCRKVREAICILDLDVLFYPTPAGGPTYRQKAQQLGGKQRFPYLVDPNTGESMYESDDIIAYLFERYGDGQVPLGLRLGFLTVLSAGIGMLPRVGKGSRYKGSGKQDLKPLVYWGYEASPFCKIAREALCELELPHLYKAAARGSPKRQQLFDARQHFQVPYLEDPNTGIAMFESSAIVEYLQKEYGASA